jgi:hypothetical protein
VGTRPLSRRGGDRTVPHQQVAAHRAFGVMHDPGRFRVRLPEQGAQTSRSAVEVVGKQLPADGAIAAAHASSGGGSRFRAASAAASNAATSTSTGTPGNSEISSFGTTASRTARPDAARADGRQKADANPPAVLCRSTRTARLPSGSMNGTGVHCQHSVGWR